MMDEAAKGMFERARKQFMDAAAIHGGYSDRIKEAQANREILGELRQLLLDLMTDTFEQAYGDEVVCEAYRVVDAGIKKLEAAEIPPPPVTAEERERRRKARGL